MGLFDELTSTIAADVEAPPALPKGTYHLVTTKVPEVKETKTGEWEVITYPCRVVAAEDDVDEDDLATFGNPAKEYASLTYLVPTEDTLENQRSLQATLASLKHLHVNIFEQDESRSMKELMGSCVGKEFLAKASHELYKDRVQVKWKNPTAIN